MCGAGIMGLSRRRTEACAKKRQSLALEALDLSISHVLSSLRPPQVGDGRVRIPELV